MSLTCLVRVEDVCCTLVSCQWTIVAEHDLSLRHWIPFSESFFIRLHVYIYFSFCLLLHLSLLLEIRIVLPNLKSVHLCFYLVIILLITIFTLKYIFNWFLFFNFITRHLISFCSLFFYCYFLDSFLIIFFQFHLSIVWQLGIWLCDFLSLLFYEVILTSWPKSWVWKISLGWLWFFFLMYFFFNFNFQHWVGYVLDFMIFFTFLFMRLSQSHILYLE
jgi:hypothetical protein